MNNKAINEIYPLFSSLDIDSKGYVFKKDLFDALERNGISLLDPRISHFNSIVSRIAQTKKIDLELFSNIIEHDCEILSKAMRNEFIIKDFTAFKQNIEEIYHDVKNNHDGENADYIPKLKNVNPEYFGVSVFTTDGQIINLGDYDVKYCIQSSCKPVNYALALQKYGVDFVHKYVGREPSGKSFNDLSLNNNNLPHNPMINAGAIAMSALLIKGNEENVTINDTILNTYKKLTCNDNISFDNSIFLSEKETGYRNYALAYYMKENNVIDKDMDIHKVLDLYFQSCALELNAFDHAKLACVFANSGIIPYTNETMFSAEDIKHTLSLMYSCGMYDFSGEFAFNVGLPAKSGVSGCLIITIPGICAICIYSPRLDKFGNSVRGVEFATQLVKKFTFHRFDTLLRQSDKINPLLDRYDLQIAAVSELLEAVEHGNMALLLRLQSKGYQDVRDYDNRTMAHIACVKNNLEILEFIYNCGYSINTPDRFGNTPLDEAKRYYAQDCVTFLENHINCENLM
jgi:glutaminase